MGPRLAEELATLAPTRMRIIESLHCGGLDVDASDWMRPLRRDCNAGGRRRMLRSSHWCWSRQRRHGSSPMQYREQHRRQAVRGATACGRNRPSILRRDDGGETGLASLPISGNRGGLALGRYSAAIGSGSLPSRLPMLATMWLASAS